MFFGYNKARRSGLSGKRFPAPILSSKSFKNPGLTVEQRSGKDRFPGPMPGHSARYNELRRRSYLRKPAGPILGATCFAGIRELYPSSARNYSCATTVRFRRSITRTGGEAGDSEPSAEGAVGSAGWSRRLSHEDLAMKTWKKVLIGVGAALVLGIIVAVTVYQSRKNLVTVQTGKVQKQNLASVVSASGEIKPKTYVNIGANAFGKIIKLHVKEGDHVKKGQLLAQLENVQSSADVNATRASVQAAETDAIAADAALKTSLADLNRAKSDAVHAKLDWDRAQGLYGAALIAKQDYDVKKAAWESADAGLAQGRGSRGPSQGAEGFDGQAHHPESGQPDPVYRRAAKNHVRSAL